ncbi:diacylglycerol kinase accessory domain (presumed) domain-containing protein [Besnoitia besnoiti]|uniref:Diacylglycerol kinase n=1 Tax=Besnoitia besnoiti TaxID=94643 RepID=A0A2A9MGA4_BESBE|nr:diacylglycerol kinase accessory domain (presumed) domain-containing protein [Besnoitia besnoiti]PFH34637.1 diacylglycerol kinase accessory domain (presumed) domain-containing protein [Besnoitia besnoiti]
MLASLSSGGRSPHAGQLEKGSGSACKSSAEIGGGPRALPSLSPAPDAAAPALPGALPSPVSSPLTSSTGAASGGTESSPSAPATAPGASSAVGTPESAPPTARGSIAPQGAPARAGAEPRASEPRPASEQQPATSSELLVAGTPCDVGAETAGVRLEREGALAAAFAQKADSEPRAVRAAPVDPKGAPDQGSAPADDEADIGVGSYDLREDSDEVELMHYLAEGGRKPRMLFIFINPTSGGNKAAAFTESGVCRLTMTTPFSCNIYIFDIREGTPGNKPGFRLLKAATELAAMSAQPSPQRSMEELRNKSNAASSAAPSIESASSPPPPPFLSMRATARDRASDDLVAQGDAHENETKNEGETGDAGGGDEAAAAGATAPGEPRGGETSGAEDFPEEDVIRVLVAGGDGTVMWCAAEAEAHHIDPMKIAFGVIPYGTGNDFANAFGWKQRRGLRPFDAAMKTMRALLAEWDQARVVQHDLWSVKVALKGNGEFTKINSETRKKQVIHDELGRRMESMAFVMSNYFSMGVESRIGRGFDRHRTQSQFLNKVTYGIEGVKKAWFKRTLAIDRIIDALIDRPGEPDEQVVFRTRDSSMTKGPILKKSVSLVALNIPSFSAGNDIWGTSQNVGILAKSPTLKREVRKIVQEKQKTGDRELEFLSFPSITSLGIEFACHGQARRVNQGKGPWKFIFKELPTKAKVYFQVDGEFFQMTHPDYVTIEHNRTVRVLAAPPDKRSRV